MPAVHSKFMYLENFKGSLVEQILLIMTKYKPLYAGFRRCSKRKLSYEAQDVISQFKSEIMSLGLPKNAAEAIHGKMLS